MTLGYVFWKTSEENCTDDFVSMFDGNILKRSTVLLKSIIPSQIDLSWALSKEMASPKSATSKPLQRQAKKSSFLKITTMKTTSNIQATTTRCIYLHWNQHYFPNSHHPNMKLQSQWDTTKKQQSDLLCRPTTTVRDIKKRFDERDSIQHPVLASLVTWMTFFIVLFYFIKVIIKVCRACSAKSSREITKTYIVTKTGKDCQCSTPFASHKTYQEAEV